VPEANVAVVTVDGDRMSLDSQPLSDLRQQAVADACREKLLSGPEAKPRPRRTDENPG
jgi:hypothetical protein